MTKWTVALAVCALAVGLVVAGCGGGDDSSGDSGAAGAEAAEADLEETTITKAEFVKQADAICTASSEKLQDDFKALRQELNGANQAESGASLITLTLNSLEATHDEITALGAPSGDGPQVEAILEPLQGAIAAAEANSKDIGPANDQLAKARKAAAAYGLTGCPLG